MEKPIAIKELNKIKGGRLDALRNRADARQRVLVQVRGMLSPRLSDAVVSAGLENGELSLGVAGASWAARLRYVTETLRTALSTSTGLDIRKVRVRVVPPA